MTNQRKINHHSPAAAAKLKLLSHAWRLLGFRGCYISPNTILPLVTTDFLLTQPAGRVSELGFRLGTAPLTNSWIIFILWSYIALNRTPNVDCYWGGAVPKV